MLRIYNTLSQKKEGFRPKQKNLIEMFVCGPTVYDFSHLGHARTYIVFDMIANYLKSLGYKVFYLQNITDVDDKIIDRAEREKVSWLYLSKKFEKEYLKDMKALGINSVKIYARATDRIKEIISQVKRLLQKGYAYPLEDGIYYDVSRFKPYGKLAKRTISQAEDAVSRIDESVKKRNRGDFALWKFSKSGEPSWPFGSLASLRVKAGRPGWHIEDTAITEKYFGPQYGIHGGARDLIFPHHEAEIAQMEAISGKKPMARYWLHSGFLTVKGQKMSKSLGNFITIRDFLKEYSPRLLRLLILKAHYRSPIDYMEELILQTKRELERIDEFVNKLKSPAFAPPSPKYLRLRRPSKASAGKQISKFKNEFNEAMEDDFNTPLAIAALFQMINRGNALLAKEGLSKKDAKEILEFLKKVDVFFKFIFHKRAVKEKIPLSVKKLLREREEARKLGDWEKADTLRKRIEAMGYSIEDTKEGPRLKKI